MEIDEFESKDITDDVVLKVTTDEKEESKEAEAEEAEKAEIPEEDHPAITLLDLAVKQSVEFCKSQKLPEPNLAVYENFSRPFLNRAFWHYLPEGDLPDDPKLALLLGFAGLGFAYIPTIVAFWKRQKEEAKVEAEKQKPKPKPVKEKEELREKAREAEKEKQEQIRQNEELTPIAKKLRYESFAGI